MTNDPIRWTFKRDGTVGSNSKDLKEGSTWQKDTSI